MNLVPVCVSAFILHRAFLRFSVRSHKIVILVRENVSARVACIARTRLYHKIAAQINNHIWN